MYGFPIDLDPGVFVGRTLEQFTMSVNTVFFWFDVDLTITVTGRYEYRTSTGEIITASAEELPETTGLPRLVGKTVTAARASSDGTLSLEFESSAGLDIVEDTPQYECYIIKYRDRQFII